MESKNLSVFRKIKFGKRHFRTPIKAENGKLTAENETLEAQLVQTNALYVAKIDNLTELTDKYSDLEEAINDKISAHLAECNPQV